MVSVTVAPPPPLITCGFTGAQPQDQATSVSERRREITNWGPRGPCKKSYTNLLKLGHLATSNGIAAMQMCSKEMKNEHFLSRQPKDKEYQQIAKCPNVKMSKVEAETKRNETGAHAQDQATSESGKAPDLVSTSGGGTLPTGVERSMQEMLHKSG